MPDTISFTPPIPKYIFSLSYLGIFNLNSEGNFAFNGYLDKKLPWFFFPKKRLLIQSGFILVWSMLTLGSYFTGWFFYNGGFLIYPPFSVLVFVTSLMLFISFFGISAAFNFFSQWKKAFMEVEQIEIEKLKSEYKALQNQVNPHFLFNSLNVLIYEIKNDPEKAEAFTRKLSQVYRYVLQSKEYDLITVKKELDFIQSFIYLHQVRAGNAIELVVNIAETSLGYFLPPLTLQLLVENAIKHTVMNEKNPLQIHIETIHPDTLVIRNNLNPKESVESTKTGLSNIKARYDLLKADGFKTEITNTEFIVTLPLLETS